MLMPRKVKHRKVQRDGAIRGNATRGATIAFGSFALKAMESGLISSRQIEAARRSMTRYVQRGGKLWIRIFPDKPMTQKGAEVPMGKGKGAVDHFVARIYAGTVLFEMDGVPEATARGAMERARHKLPVSVKFIRKDVRV